METHHPRKMRTLLLVLLTWTRALCFTVRVSELPLPAAKHRTARSSLDKAVPSPRCWRKHSRWMPSLSFKPDDSVELYGNDDDDEKDDDSEGEETGGPDLQLMATFLANRLGRAYLRNAQRRTESTEEPSVDQPTISESEPSSAGDVVTTDEEGSEATVETSVLLSDTSNITEVTERSTTQESLPKETIESDGTSAVAMDVTPTLEATEKGTEKEKSVVDETKISQDNQPNDGEAIDRATVEIPSLQHEKEGDRSIGLADEIVETTVDGEQEDVMEVNWTTIPLIPKEISLEFGRPLPVVEKGIPPIRT